MNNTKILSQLDALLTAAASAKPASQKNASFYGSIKKAAKLLDPNFKPKTIYPYRKIKEGGEIDKGILDKIKDKKKVALIGVSDAKIEAKKEKSEEKKAVVKEYSLPQMKKYVQNNFAASKQLAIDDGAVKAQEVNALSEEALAKTLFDFYQLKKKADAS